MALAGNIAEEEGPVAEHDAGEGAAAGRRDRNRHRALDDLLFLVASPWCCLSFSCASISIQVLLRGRRAAAGRIVAPTRSSPEGELCMSLNVVRPLRTAGVREECARAGRLLAAVAFDGCLQYVDAIDDRFPAPTPTTPSLMRNHVNVLDPQRPVRGGPTPPANR